MRVGQETPLWRTTMDEPSSPSSTALNLSFLCSNCRAPALGLLQIESEETKTQGLEKHDIVMYSSDIHRRYSDLSTDSLHQIFQNIRKKKKD
jgi:hypothetical protein